MLNNIRADLARRIAASVNLVDSESTEVSKVEEEEEFQAELEKDLKYSLDRLNAFRSKPKCTSRSWWDLSVEVRNPLEPRIDDAVDGGDSGDDELWKKKKKKNFLLILIFFFFFFFNFCFF